MSLILTHRFNWMGHEGTESQVVDIGLLRLGDAGGLRYNDYRQRQQAVMEMRMRLKLIKRDLGLLPPEETIESEAGRLSPDSEDLQSCFELDNKTEGGVGTLTSGRNTDGTSRRHGGHSDDDENIVYLYPPEPSMDEVSAATQAFSAALKTLLIIKKETYVSYLDGKHFSDISELQEYNATRRAAVQDAIEESDCDVQLPPASEFDLGPILAAVEEKDQLRMKIDAVRASYHADYAERCIRKDELDNNGKPVTNVRVENEDISALCVNFRSMRRSLIKTRDAYNERAGNAARSIQTALANEAIPV